jgi:hypothetical protein
LFVEVLASYQAMINTSGILSLTTPRDAFLTSLSKFAIPSRVVSSLDTYIEPPTASSRTSALITENLGLGLTGGGRTEAPGLSERNMACLKVLVGSAGFLAGGLGASWFGVLEALQNADYVLSSKGVQGSGSSGGVGGGGNRRNSTFGIGGVGGGVTGGSRLVSGASASAATSSAQNQPHPASRHPLLTDLDPDSIQTAIQRLFDSSKNLEDRAFQDFVGALCKLSSEMVGMQLQSMEGARVEGGSMEELGSPIAAGGLSPGAAHRRRVSGIHLPRTLVSAFKFEAFVADICVNPNSDPAISVSIN